MIIFEQENISERFLRDKGGYTRIYIYKKYDILLMVYIEDIYTKIFTVSI